MPSPGPAKPLPLNSSNEPSRPSQSSTSYSTRRTPMKPQNECSLLQPLEPLIHSAIEYGRRPSQRTYDLMVRSLETYCETLSKSPHNEANPNCGPPTTKSLQEWLWQRLWDTS